MSFAANTPKLFKGAFVAFTEPFLGPIPNIVVFQYNPDRLDREITISAPVGDGRQAEPGTNPQASPRQPVEVFRTVTLEIDATDQLESPALHPVTTAFGITAQLAALELLVYPVSAQLLGGFFSFKRPVPQDQVPTVLFVWGPSRLLPVRLTSLSIKEESFDVLLHPTRATVTAGLRVLTEDDMAGIKSPLADVARKAWKFSRGLRETLARTNLISSGEFGLGSLLR